MKYEWRKKDKEIYLPKKIEILSLQAMKYFTITGAGNPNGEVFKECIEALYALSYGLKMLPKKGLKVDNYYEYTVFPLEANWSLSQEGIEKYEKNIPVIELKDDMVFKVMIRQPDFLTEELFLQVKDLVFMKKKNSKVLDVKFESIDEGLIAQMIHIGSYDDEVKSFKLMEDFIESKGYERKSMEHREIYISDPRRVDVSKLKTTIRVWIKAVKE